LFARRISHHDGDAAQADEPRQPTDRHPSAADASVNAVMEEAPDGRGDQGDGQKSAERVPEARDWVALVYVAPDGLRLTLEDETDLILHLRKILARVDAHERARRTVLLTRVSVHFRAGRIERRVIAEIAFDREQVINLCH